MPALRAGKKGQIVNKCHYVLTLENGTMADCSHKRDQAFVFEIGEGQVIEGWDEGVAKMSVGQRAKLTISPEKGYGEEGILGSIPPDSTLIFDIELLSIS